MPPTCQAILATGLPCNHRAKQNDKCGTHKNTDSNTSIDHIQRRIRYIYRLDYQNVLNFVLADRPLHWRPATVQVALEHVSVLEGLIRPLYPGWEGPFIQTNNTAIQERSGNARARAERNIPPNILRIPGQIHVMHGWYTGLRDMIVATNTLPLNEVGVDELYNPITFAATVRPAIIAAWNRYNDARKDWFRRLVHNMRILNQAHLVELAAHVALPPDPAAAAVAAVRQGNQFINDNQNVHRKSTVDYIEKVFNELKKVPIQADQKTLGEILVNCTMKAEAQVQMVRFYHAGESIYEHPRAYKRALDSVWAFIRKHENRKELYVRIGDEMNDNIGMCAQGNLSRICNVLCGYIDGFQPPVPQGTLVQNKIAAIAGDSDGDKVGRAKIALRELMVPEDQWAPWLEALEE